MLPGNEDARGPRSDIKEITFLYQPIGLETTPTGGKITIIDKIDNPEEYQGPVEFDALVNFGGLFRRLGMWNSCVPRPEQWVLPSDPPEGITILEFGDDRLNAKVKAIGRIAREDFYQDEHLCQSYYDLNEYIFKSIADYQMRDFNWINKGEVIFLGLIRAGVVAGKMLGFEVENQILVQTKRLHIKGEVDGDIAVGITPLDRQRMEEIDGKDLIIGDPAGATLSSVGGNLLYLDHLGIHPRAVNIWNTVISHRGALFGLALLRKLGIKGEIVAGGYSPGMNNRYYLEDNLGNPSVRDAGDGLDRFLPESLRLLNRVTKGS